MLQLRVCIDVDDVERGIAFYTQVLGLEVGRRFNPSLVELLGASAPIDLLGTEPGSVSSPGGSAQRDFRRHWTPVHLDFLVDDVGAAVARATEAGAVLEGEIRTEVYGRQANLADPFGHGICLIQMNEVGYDALLRDG
jgi:predicted enzyme related to lactoylglutathione lyase